VPALVGLAFGAAPALAPQHLIQLGSAVSPVAAFGPGVVEPSAVSGVAASGPGVAVPVTGGPFAAGTPIPSSMTMQEVLGMGTFGGGPIFANTPTMVYDPTYNSMAPLPGIGELVYNPDSPVIGHTAATMPRVGLGSPLIDLAMQPHISRTMTAVFNPTWLPGHEGFVGG
jgi:hypothetical protein